MKTPFTRNRAGATGEVRRAEPSVPAITTHRPPANPSLLETLTARYGNPGLARQVVEAEARIQGEDSLGVAIPEQLQRLRRELATAQRELDSAVERHNVHLAPINETLAQARKELATAEAVWTESPARLRFVAAQNAVAVAEDALTAAARQHDQETADVRHRVTLAAFRIERGPQGLYPVNNLGLKFEQNWRPANYDPQRTGPIPDRAPDSESTYVFLENGMPRKDPWESGK